MTLAECKTATASLVFTEELADLGDTAETGFYRALARAIWVTDGLRPRKRLLYLHHTPPFESAAEVGECDVLYDLTSLAPDLACVTEPPACRTGASWLTMTAGYVLSGGRRLYLRRDIPGEIRLCYRVRPEVPTEETDPDVLLGLDEDLCQLLPLLIAHYLLLDDDGEKSAHYLSLYREQYALLKTAASVSEPTAYRSVNSW